MKLTLLLLLSFALTSCGRMTPSEIEEAKLYCESAGQEFRLSQTASGDNFFCAEKEDKVQSCIKMYVSSIDEKYNNPDTVSNLREEGFSQVVETCNRIYGSQSITK